MLNNIDYLMLIAGRKQKDTLISALLEMGGRNINVIYAKGSVKANYLTDIFGLVPEENKILLTCLFPDEKIDSVLDMLVKEHQFDKPNTGIAFTLPIESLSF